jgi:aldehyde:ferredoxin oxidoreductase
MDYPIIESIAAVTGWDYTMEEALKTGHRIQTLRQAFIQRDGISPSDFHLPDRISKTQTEGPLAEKVLDFITLRSNYYEVMEWESEGAKSGHPREKTLKELGLDKLVKRYGVKN